MKLLLYVENDFYEIPDVTLKDKIIPCLSGVPYSGSGTSEELLEPAIWFKIHMMESLTIDCRTQVVYWTVVKPLGSTKSDQEISDEMIRGEKSCPKNVVKLSEDCIDYVNGLDEVFDTVPILLNSFRSNETSQTDFYQTLIQLLHVNVLPNIKLSSEYLHLVEKSVVEYTSLLVSLDEVVVSKTNMLLELKKTKQREKQKLIHSLINLKKLPSFDDDFIKVLENDLKSDAEKISSDSKFHEQNKSKYGRLSKNNSEEGELTNYDIHNITSALEKLSRIKSRSKLSWFYVASPTSDDHQLQKLYIKMAETEDRMRTSIRCLLDRKMMLRSIIETMKSVIGELQQGLDSYGIELNTKSFVDTSNIIGESLTTKSWTSLPTHIYNILSNPNHQITKEHLAMTCNICEATKSILHEHSLQCLFNSLVPDSERTFITCSETNKNSVYSTFESDLLLNLSFKSKSCADISKFDECPTKQGKIQISSSTLTVSCKNSKPNFKTLPCKKMQLQSNSFVSDYVFVYDSSSSSISAATEKLKQPIFDHFHRICKKIQMEIDKTYLEKKFKKVWVIYENYFYEHTMNGLLKVFKAQYSNKAKVLIKFVEMFTVEDLDLTDSLMSKLLLGPLVDNLIATDAGCSFRSLSNTPDEASFASSHHRFSSSDDDDDDDLYDNDEGSFDFSSSRLSIQILNKEMDSQTMKFQQGGTKSQSSPDFLLSPSTDHYTFSIRLKPWIMKRFGKAYQSIDDALKAKTPKTKTHHLLRCLRNVTCQIENIYKEVCKKTIKLCSDDIMDALIILLCNLKDLQTLEDLYIQVQFLTHVLAQFFCNGEYHFALVQFLVVCQYLHDKAFMKKNKAVSSSTV